MQSEERELVKQNQEMERQIKAGLAKEWKAKTVKLEDATGLRLVKFSQDLIDLMILHWSDGRMTILEAQKGENYGDEWKAIEENKQRTVDFMKQVGILDKKALDYIDEVRGKIKANDKKLQKFMLERQLERYKKELEALDG